MEIKTELEWEKFPYLNLTCSLFVDIICPRCNRRMLLEFVSLSEPVALMKCSECGIQVMIRIIRG